MKYNIVNNFIYTITIYDEIKYISFKLNNQHMRVQRRFSLIMEYDQ